MTRVTSVLWACINLQSHSHRTIHSPSLHTFQHLHYSLRRINTPLSLFLSTSRDHNHKQVHGSSFGLNQMKMTRSFNKLEILGMVSSLFHKDYSFTVVRSCHNFMEARICYRVKGLDLSLILKTSKLNLIWLYPFFSLVNTWLSRIFGLDSSYTSSLH